MSISKNLVRIALLAIVVSLFVVMLGAYTRLTHAGLGCPDWPGCYGHMVVSASEDAQARFPLIPIESRKAWTEMAHRYAAGSLVFLVLCLNIGVYRVRRAGKKIPFTIPIALIVLIAFQALLGMWTVTMKLLPIVVMAHLLGGILIFSSLCYFRMQLSDVRQVDNPYWRFWISLGLLLVFFQIALGGWVSSNYAGLACIGFPQCNGQWLPALHFSEGFHLFSPVGANYQGGVLDSVARMTIQMVHRLGAVIVASYVLILACILRWRVQFSPLRDIAAFAIVLVLIQFFLGVANVVFLLPLSVAVAHNGVAALLLAILFAMRYLVSGGACNEHSF